MMKFSSSSSCSRIQGEERIQDQPSAAGIRRCMPTTTPMTGSSNQASGSREIEVKSHPGNKRTTPSSPSSSSSSPSSSKSGSWEQNFPFHQIRCLLFYLFYVNWSKAPSITRILMINICLMASAGFFVFSSLLAYISIIMPTSVFLHLMVKCLLLQPPPASFPASSS